MPGRSCREVHDVRSVREQHERSAGQRGDRPRDQPGRIGDVRLDDVEPRPADPGPQRGTAGRPGQAAILRGDSTVDRRIADRGDADLGAEGAQGLDPRLHERAERGVRGAADTDWR